jgi:hypothetical protein
VQVDFAYIREQAADRKARHKSKKSKSKHRRRYDSDSESEEERRRRKRRREREERHEKERGSGKDRNSERRRRSRSESRSRVEWVEKGDDKRKVKEVMDESRDKEDEVSGDEVGPNLPTNIIGKDGKIDRAA